MTTKKSKKLCWNCEGELERDAILCRYCGVNVLHVACQETSGEDLQVPPPPYAAHASNQLEEASPSSEDNDTMPTTRKHFSLTGLLSLVLASFFFLFAFFLLFFSKEGVLTLQWDASYWLFYILFSLPFFFLGWRFSRSN